MPTGQHCDSLLVLALALALALAQLLIKLSSELNLIPRTTKNAQYVRTGLAGKKEIGVICFITGVIHSTLVLK